MDEHEHQAGTHDEALELAMELGRRRHREGRSSQWLVERIEGIKRSNGDAFFNEGEIWEMVDSF